PHPPPPPSFPTRRSSDLVGCDIRFDRDRKRRTNCFAQLAGDAALLSVRVAALRMQSAVARRLRRLLLRILDRNVRTKRELPEGEDRKSTRLNSSHVKISY